MAYIELNDLSFAYPGPAGEVKALEHVSFSVRGGEFLSVVGRSGCGKSTLLRLLAGLEEPGSGSVTIGGEPASVPGRGRMIVFQTGGLFPWQTVRGNVIFAMRQTHRGLSRAESAERADALLQTVELADAAGGSAGVLDPAIAGALGQDALDQALDLRFVVQGPAEPERAQVTRGGLLTGQFDPATLEARERPGLFACGEALNVDGACGGFNLAWAWKSGLVAGRAAAGRRAAGHGAERS